MSVGVATSAPTADAALSDLLDAADSALYEAKRAGRNRVVVAVANHRVQIEPPAA